MGEKGRSPSNRVDLHLSPKKGRGQRKSLSVQKRLSILDR